MIIPDERIDDFIKRWENAFGETLSREEARARAMQLVEFYRMIGRHPPGDGHAASPTAEAQTPRS